eukprot:UN5130
MILMMDKGRGSKQARGAQATTASSSCEAILWLHPVSKSPVATSCLQLEAHITLLEEAHNLVCSCDPGVVVGLQGLGAHLLLREDDPLHELVFE